MKPSSLRPALLLSALVVAFSSCGMPPQPRVPVAPPTTTTPPAPETVTPVPETEDSGSTAGRPAVRTPVVRPVDPPEPPTSVAPKHPLTVRTVSKKGIELTAVTFDRRDFRLKVIDQKGGPGSRFDDAEEAARSVGGVAAINGGFFSPEGSPVGLVISDGDSRGALNRTSFLGTGIVDGEKVSLATRQSYQKSSELLQSGPRLVWQDETLTGLSRSPSRPRSFVIWDGREHFGLAFADSASLLGLSEALIDQPFPGFKLRYAVNLDGGTSCDLWVSDAVPGGDLTKRSFFRKKVRNYLVLKAR